MAQRLVYIVADIDKAVAFEWIADLLDAERFDVSFVLLNPGPSELERELERRGVPCERIRYRGYRDLPAAFARLFRLLRRLRPSTVHAHLLPACLGGLPAATLAGVPQRVYTRHHSTFHHDYAPHWVMVDRALNALATHIVAISANVRDVLHELEGVPRGKLRLVHHGFRVADFDAVTPERVAALRTLYGLEGRSPVIGVIARYIEWKGIDHIVRAAERILLVHPEAVFVFANARGDGAVAAEVARLPEANRLEIPFEPDLFALYGLFDVYVHTPIDPRVEAFGQTYVEALLARVPSVFTLSGVAREFVEDDRNALVVPYRDPAATAEAVLRLLEDPEPGRRLAEQGRADVQERFGVERMIGALEALYSEAKTAPRTLR